MQCRRAGGDSSVERDAAQHVDRVRLTEHIGTLSSQRTEETYRALDYCWSRSGPEGVPHYVRQ